MEEYIKKVEHLYNKKFLEPGTIVQAYGLKLEVEELAKPDTYEKENLEIRRYPYVCRRLDGGGTFTYSFYQECKIGDKELGDSYILGNSQDKKINKLKVIKK